MKVILDSTAIFHLYYHYNKMNNVFKENGVTEMAITRINYLEILSGAAGNAKLEVKKYLQQYPVIELNTAAASVANNLAIKYQVGSKQKLDFLIASIAIANKVPLLTENSKDFTACKGLKLLPYKISSWL
ncbi:MAG TPA: type II toxin-antitoxin system VapC family toxin [Chitinophagaceae bacterium]|nr:type II toxin-antitoxin system VapC family toxin [Chitinophagaceae bacterium]HNE93416.1 type II toxin-antitoxin system VapC family toxin [Chitinophagaceae bacterium]HNJ58673.1 type II toxin-antitoxin system VapC family toxin [Chitinophagaceae bacterium]HNM33695.1 type II toxin-antitoxin system VapC family toxin [Chitinophagaceae bacterium]HNN31006.1 type II toxin-antitoxin system VapC family toxin [Chitinophagaceae bacterium]